MDVSEKGDLFEGGGLIDISMDSSIFPKNVNFTKQDNLVNECL